MLWSASRQFPRDFERFATMLVTLKIQVSDFSKLHLMKFIKRRNDDLSVSAAEISSMLHAWFSMWCLEISKSGTRGQSSTVWFFEWLLWQYLVHSSIQHHKTCQKAQIWNFSQILSNQIVTEKSDFLEKSIWKLIARFTAVACWIKIENGFKYFHTYGHLFQRLT